MPPRPALDTAGRCLRTDGVRGGTLEGKSGSSEAPHELLRVRRPRILIVEDDMEMWRLIERAVRAANPDVAIHWAKSAGAARAALESTRFDAVLADFMLEGEGDGWTVLAESRRLQPGARVAMASSLPLRPPKGDHCPFLQKPFDVAGCAAFVSRLLV